MKLIEVEKNNVIYKYSQLENLTDAEVNVALKRGFLNFFLSNIEAQTDDDDDFKYFLIVDDRTGELILGDRTNHTIKLRGVDEISKFMIKNDLGVIADIISLEEVK